MEGLKKSRIKRAIIPVAGLGTRMLPATKAVPKEMLPIFDKPLIQHVVEEAANAGINEIILVTRSGKEAIENHFDSNYELESLLSSKGKKRYLKSFPKLILKNISLISVRQDKPLGLGHAILCAKKILDYGESFCVILPDEFLVSNQKINDLELMIENFHETSHGQILVEKVKRQLVTNYGIVDINTKLLLKNKSELINGMIEKPSIQKAPSNYRVIGRYILPYEILKILDKEKPAKDGEIQLTDALQKCINQKKYFFDAYQSNSTVYDCGSIKGFLGANIALASKDKEIKQYLMKNFS